MILTGTIVLNGAEVPVAISVPDNLLIEGPPGEPGVPGDPGAASSPGVINGSDAGWAAIAIGSGQETFVYTMQRAVVDVVAGQKLWIYAEAQVRNDTGWNVEFAQAIFVRPFINEVAPSTFDNDFDTGRISPINGWNITPAEHYGRASKAKVWTAPTTGKFAIDLRVRARSSSASGGGGVNLAVQQGQGVLEILRWSAP